MYDEVKDATPLGSGFVFYTIPSVLAYLINQLDKVKEIVPPFSQAASGTVKNKLYEEFI